jgi:hypothetical protein
MLLEMQKIHQANPIAMGLGQPERYRWLRPQKKGVP